MEGSQISINYKNSLFPLISTKKKASVLFEKKPSVQKKCL